MVCNREIKISISIVVLISLISILSTNVSATSIKNDCELGISLNETVPIICETPKTLSDYEEYFAVHGISIDGQPIEAPLTINENQSNIDENQIILTPSGDIEPNACSAPSTGDWTINSNDTSCADTTIELNGNISIVSGGNLTLSNVQLIFNMNGDASNNITVWAGGSLHITGSNITTNNTNREFLWQVKKGGYMNLENSYVSECGTAWTTSLLTAGIVLLGNGSRVVNTTVNNSMSALSIQNGSFNFIANNTFATVFGDDIFDIFGVNSLNNTIRGNYIHGAGAPTTSSYNGFQFGGHNQTIEFNYLKRTGQCIRILGSYAYIYNNTCELANSSAIVITGDHANVSNNYVLEGGIGGLGMGAIHNKFGNYSTYENNVVEAGDFNQSFMVWGHSFVINNETSFNSRGKGFVAYLTTNTSIDGLFITNCSGAYPNGGGFYWYGSFNNSLHNFNISASDAMYWVDNSSTFPYSVNNTMIDGWMNKTGGASYWVLTIDNASNSRNYLINVTYKNTSVYFTGPVGTGGWFIRGWKVRVYVNDSTNGNPLNGLNVTFNDTWNTDFNYIITKTGADGYTPWLNISIHNTTQNGSSGAPLWNGTQFYAPYTVRVFNWSKNATVLGYTITNLDIGGGCDTYMGCIGSGTLYISVASGDAPGVTINRTNATTTSPKYAGSIQFNFTVGDSSGVSAYILSWNVTGTWANESDVLLGGSPASTIVLVNKSIGNYGRRLVGWKVFVNNTINRWNVSDEYYFNIINSVPTMSGNAILVPTVNATTASLWNCSLNGSTADVDGDTVYLYYDWYNGTSIKSSGQNPTGFKSWITRLGDSSFQGVDVSPNNSMVYALIVGTAKVVVNRTSDGTGVTEYSNAYFGSRRSIRVIGENEFYTFTDASSICWMDEWNTTTNVTTWTYSPGYSGSTTCYSGAVLSNHTSWLAWDNGSTVTYVGRMWMNETDSSMKLNNIYNLSIGGAIGELEFDGNFFYASAVNGKLIWKFDTNFNSMGYVNVTNVGNVEDYGITGMGTADGEHFYILSDVGATGNLTAYGLRIQNVSNVNTSLYPGFKVWATEGGNLTCQITPYDTSEWGSAINSSGSDIYINYRPTFNESLTAQFVNDDAEWIYNINCSDIGGDVITYTDNFTYSNVNSSGHINWTPQEVQAGVYGIAINCSDGSLNVTEDFTLTVYDVTSPSLVFDSPTPNNETRQIANTYIIQALYYENNTISKCLASINGTNYTMTNYTGICNYSYTAGDGDVVTFKVWANDSSNNFGVSELRQVKENAIPSLETPPNNSTNEDIIPPDKFYNISSYGSDSVSVPVWDTIDTLTFDIQSETNSSLIDCYIYSNMYMNCSKPSANQTGLNNITINVTDGYQWNSTTFSINVTPVNDAPNPPTSMTDLGTHETNHTPTVTWVKGTDVDRGDAVTTFIYCDTNNPPLTTEGNTAGTTWDLTCPTTDGQTYYYSLRSYDGQLWSANVTDSFRMNSMPHTANIDAQGTQDSNHLTNHTPEISWGYSDAEGDTQRNTTIIVSSASSRAGTIYWNSTQNSSSISVVYYGESITDGTLIYIDIRNYDGYEWGNWNESYFTFNSIPQISAQTYTDNSTAHKFLITSTISDANADAMTCTLYHRKNGETTYASKLMATNATIASATIGTTDANSSGVSYTVGATIQMYVYCTDSYETNQTSATTHNIPNQAPTVSSASILPSNPTTNDNLQCNYTGYNDAEGDSISAMNYTWYNTTTLNSFFTGTANSLLGSGNTTKNEGWWCMVQPIDVYGGIGNGVNASNTTINNSIPSVVSATIYPSAPTTNDDLTCNNGTTTDADNDGVTLYYQWYVDGVANVTTQTVDNSKTTNGELWICQLTPYDGAYNGTPVNSSSVDIGSGNSPPSILANQKYYNSTTIHLFIVNATASDPEGNDTIEFCTIYHRINGEDDYVAKNGTYDSTTAECTVTISDSEQNASGTNYTVGMTIQTYIKFTDDTAATASTSASTNSLPNQAPTLNNNPNINGTVLRTTNNLYCNYTGAYADIENDVEGTTMFKWYKGGILQTSTDQTLDAGNTTVNDLWSCSVTPKDTHDKSGVEYKSENISIQNTAPSIPWVQPIANIDPIAKTRVVFRVNFTAYDPDGYANMISPRVDVYRGTQNATDDTCDIIEQSGGYTNYTCETLFLEYWYLPGEYHVNATIFDQSSNSSSNKTSNFTYSSLLAYDMTPTSISWSNLAIGSSDLPSNSPISINNTANANITVTKITGYNLVGNTNTTIYIGVTNFTINVSDSAIGQRLSNGSSVNITSSSIASGYNSLIRLYCYADIPPAGFGLTQQYYSADSFYSKRWEVTADET